MSKKSAAASLFATAMVFFALLGNAEGGKKTDVYTVCMHLFPSFPNSEKKPVAQLFFARKHSRKELRMCIWERRVRQATSDSSKNSLPESRLLPFFPSPVNASLPREMGKGGETEVERGALLLLLLLSITEATLEASLSLCSYRPTEGKTGRTPTSHL